MKNNLLMIALVGLTGCATTSGVMPGPNGTFMISSFAAPIRGGATGAYKVAFEDAQKHCAGMGKNAVVVDGTDRDVYQSTATSYGNLNANSGGLNASHGASSGTFASGTAKLIFKCEGGSPAPAPAK